MQYSLSFYYYNIASTGVSLSDANLHHNYLETKNKNGGITGLLLLLVSCK